MSGPGRRIADTMPKTSVDVNDAVRRAELLLQSTGVINTDASKLRNADRKVTKEINPLRARLEKIARIKELPECAPLDVSLAPDLEVRDYQAQVVQDTLDLRDKNPPQSAIIVLPCGAGKTIVGIATCVADCQQGALYPKHAVGSKAFLIVCDGPEGAQYWYDSFLKFTNFNKDSIALLMSGDEDVIVEKGRTRIVIAGICLLTNSNAKNNRIMNKVMDLQYHRAVLDECHMMPARNARQILKGDNWNIERWTGLTASPLRADNQYEWIVNSIGTQLYPVKWRELEARGYLTPLSINLLRCPLPDSWLQTYNAAPPEEKRRYDVFNPRKLAMLEKLLRFWKQENEKENHTRRVTIVFCDTIELLRLICQEFDILYIDGNVSAKDTLYLLDQVRNGQISVIAMSRSGDQGIDLPCVSRIIILDALDGSQRQEVQRAGRALRPYPGKHEAQLFDIHTDSTRSIFYANERIKFLQEQEYPVNHLTISHSIHNGVSIPSDTFYFERNVMHYNRFANADKQQEILDSIHSLKERQEANREGYDLCNRKLQEARQERNKQLGIMKRMQSNPHLDNKTKNLFKDHLKKTVRRCNSKIVKTHEEKKSHTMHCLDKTPYTQKSITSITKKG